MLLRTGIIRIVGKSNLSRQTIFPRPYSAKFLSSLNSTTDEENQIYFVESFNDKNNDVQETSGLLHSLVDSMTSYFEDILTSSGSLNIAVLSTIPCLLSLSIITGLLHFRLVKKRHEKYKYAKSMYLKLIKDCENKHFESIGSEFKLIEKNYYKMLPLVFGKYINGVLQFIIVRKFVYQIDGKLLEPHKFLWVDNLLEPDPYYVIPLLTVGSIILTVFADAKKKLVLVPVGLLLTCCMAYQTTIFLIFYGIYILLKKATNIFFSSDIFEKYTSCKLKNLEQEVMSMKYEMAEYDRKLTKLYIEREQISINTNLHRKVMRIPQKK